MNENPENPLDMRVADSHLKMARANLTNREAAYLGEMLRANEEEDLNMTLRVNSTSETSETTLHETPQMRSFLTQLFAGEFTAAKFADDEMADPDLVDEAEAEVDDEVTELGVADEAEAEEVST